MFGARILGAIQVRQKSGSRRSTAPLCERPRIGPRRRAPSDSGSYVINPSEVMALRTKVLSIANVSASGCSLVLNVRSAFE